MALLKYLCPLDDLPVLVQKETIVPVTESSVAKKKENGKYVLRKSEHRQVC